VKEKNKTECSFKSKSRPSAKRIGTSVLIIKRGNKKETLSSNAGGTEGVLSKFLRKPKIRPKRKTDFWT